MSTFVVVRTAYFRDTRSFEISEIEYCMHKEMGCAFFENEGYPFLERSGFWVGYQVLCLFWGVKNCKFYWQIAGKTYCSIKDV